MPSALHCSPKKISPRSRVVPISRSGPEPVGGAFSLFQQSLIRQSTLGAANEKSGAGDPSSPEAKRPLHHRTAAFPQSACHFPSRFYINSTSSFRTNYMVSRSSPQRQSSQVSILMEPTYGNSGEHDQIGLRQALHAADHLRHSFRGCFFRSCDSVARTRAFRPDFTVQNRPLPDR